VKDPHAEARKSIEDAVLRGPARTPASLRQALAALSEEDIPEELRAFANKIESHPIRVTDADFATLRAKYSEDELFEIVVATALGASMRRLSAGLAALEGVE
jgi:alkylhydroperoxidase family enzyme